MLALALAATLAAAPAPAPRVAASTVTVLHVPRFDQLQGLTAFMTRAGASSQMLNPTSWQGELHPFLILDPTRPDSLDALGIDATGPLSVSIRQDGRLSCTRVKDPKAFQDASANVLARNGDVKAGTVKGVTTLRAPTGLGGYAGYVIKGQEACAFVSADADEALRKEATKLVTKAPAADARMGAVPGVLYVATQQGVVGLDGTANGLKVEGTATKLPLPPFQSQGTSPYGAMAPTGLLFSRAQVAPTGVAQATGSMRSVARTVCPDCDEAQVKGVTDALAKQLTGNMLFAVDSVQVKGSLRKPEVRFFAAKQALAAEVLDAAAVKAALAPLTQLPGAKVLEDGYMLEAKGGRIYVRLKGKHLVVGNDSTVTQTVMTSLPEKGAPLGRAVEFTLDPKKLARGLSQVSLMDVMGDETLAAFFGASTELGPLLAKSERITGWLDSAPNGSHRFSVNWTLPEKP
ncbi:hypothetical protein OV208_23280 [Corallococcus sp. bb12-1]|uniref:hypothetical protein n=1 Tax=Corallococcus sp. bb12-1 TaxID=2996784 RepID=UPI00226ECD48|nr:hypothetical protein [Corallococcus sp. bb12-1]MCY1044261.1 hypothetical protein [Corallococcus sp. bb12-1]